jgi:hypothetical protein
MPADYDDVRLMLRPAARVSPWRPATLGAEIVLAFVAKLGRMPTAPPLRFAVS